MKHRGAMILSVVGFSVVALGLAWLAVVGVVLTTAWTWAYSDSDLLWHDTYFVIDGQPVSSIAFYLLFIGSPLILVSVGIAMMSLSKPWRKMQLDDST